MKHSGGDKIIISKRGASWVYFSVHDDQDNGTIIDFIENRSGKTIREIGCELSSWLGGGVAMPPPACYVPEVKEQEFDPRRVERIFSGCKPAFYHPYLARRGLYKAVLSSPRFAGRIYTDRHGNAVFPHYEQGQLCGLELKGPERAVFVRGSKKTFWRSALNPEDKTLVISEAVIDAISYHIVYPDPQAFYIATGGGMSAEQGTLIQTFVQNYAKINSVLIITDHDAGGDRLAEKLQSVLEQTRLSGSIKRHSPAQQGQDWNDVLRLKT